MECSLLSCKNQAIEVITCDDCFVPKYCSEACKLNDSNVHIGVCRPHLFTLKDFIPVKDSKKIIGTGASGEVQLVQKAGSKNYFALKIVKKSI